MCLSDRLPKQLGRNSRFDRNFSTARQMKGRQDLRECNLPGMVGRKLAQTIRRASGPKICACSAYPLSTFCPGNLLVHNSTAANEGSYDASSCIIGA
jgi:hypothetical protein